MKSVAWCLVFCAILIAPVSAYSLYIDCPEKIIVGQTVKVTGNSTFPVGTNFDIVFYQAKYTTSEVDRKTVVLQDYNNKTFLVAFSTKGLEGGQYKVEVQFDTPREDQLSSDSRTLKLINVQDRSSEITMTSPMVQTLSEALRIEGSIEKLGNAGVQIEVRGPEGPVFGPTWIATKKEMKMGAGEFTKQVPVNQPGEYDVHFSDTSSYIGVVTIRVTQPTTVPPTVHTTVPTTRPPTTVPTTTPTPTPTQSPISPLPALISLSIIGGAAVLAGRKKRNK